MFTKIIVKNYHGQNFSNWGEHNAMSNYYSLLTLDFVKIVNYVEKNGVVHLEVLLPYQSQPTTIELVDIGTKPFK